MKPVYLEFCGINSFSEKAQIDFERLLEGGLFGIFGDTGSGKSTILDCIHFALYGKIERASGSVTDSINYKCDRAYVIYDFEILKEGVRHVYRVRRERRRKNNYYKAELDEKAGEKWQALADGPGEVDKAVEEIVGLGFDDFKKCIALPQGEFAGLVKAKPSERLSLVARLFDLGKYGDGLSKAVRDRCAAAENDLAVLQSRLGENAEGTEERIREEREKLAAAAGELEGVKKAFAAAEEKCAALSGLSQEKKKYEDLLGRIRAAEEKMSFYNARREKLRRCAAAAAVLEKAEARKTAEREGAQAHRLAESEAMKFASLQDKTALRKKQLEESGLDERIRSLSVVKGKLEAAEGDIESCREAQKKLDDCTDRYRKLKDKFPGEDFDGLLAANDRAREALGADESFTEYLRRNFKDVLLSDAYGEFRADLGKIAEKFPETAGEIKLISQKYRPVASGSERSFDIAQAKMSFDAAEKKRGALVAEREKIERRKKDFEENEREKQQIIAEGKLHRVQLEAATKKIQSIRGLGTPEEIEKQISAAERAKKQAEQTISEYEEALRNSTGLLAKYRTREQSEAEKAKAASEALSALLEKNGFSGEAEASALIAEIGDEGRAREECDLFFAAYDADRERLKDFPQGKFDGFSEEALSLAEAEKQALSARKEELLQAIAVGTKETERLSALRERYLQIEREMRQKEKEKSLLEKLRALTDRGKFMAFIASEYLQEICVSASRTLLSLTSGRYFLRYEDDFKAGDNLNGGALRSVRTLSGGETFLVSLSLALALSGAICAKSLRPIEFFFLDEGFGTLDEKLVDVVMDVLEKLRSRNFSVGIISHVEELKHRIDNKILVTGATEGQGSKVRVEAY